MEMRKIPSTGEAIPAIGLGTWSVFDVGAGTRARAAQRAVLERFYAAGARLIDSSPMYGRAEGVAGDLIRDLDARDRTFIATKVWTTGKSKGVAQMEDSLRLFHTDTIDLMQVHNLVDWRTHLDTLAGWKREGRVRYVGITHYVASALPDLARTIEAAPGIDYVQMAYSVADRAPERSFLPMCADKGIAVLVNKPLDTGGLISRLARRKLPDWAGEIGCTSWPQLCLKYVLANPAVTCLIPATANPDHMTDNLAAGVGRLPDDAMRKRIIGAVEGA
jgi:aryl-alcohol dehydrogenase-like predicted oxidoreductase